MLSLKELISLAKGEGEVDLLFEDAQVLDVFSGKSFRTDVAVARGVVVGFGRYGAKRKVNLKGRFLSPAFIDAHVHIESSMVTPREYARAVIPHGVTTAICDFHEIANCLGQEGI
ncbi:MAG TPA: adenine deaminase, partial [Deltaproteobacteria bacterium]|nr:adenine deaminase [Deltaproteobacteria bacterium]